MTTHTTAPQFKNKNVVVEPVKTETKTTQGDTYFEYTLKEKITVQYVYNNEVEYEIGDKLPLLIGKEGFYMLDGYKCDTIEGYIRNGKEEKTNHLPLALFETKQYVVVREYRTTFWEIK